MYVYNIFVMIVYTNLISTFFRQYYTMGWDERHRIFRDAVTETIYNHPEIDRSTMILQPFNSMTTLSYWNKRESRYADGAYKDEDQLGDHCDTGYDEYGNRLPGSTQQAYTPTIVLCLGDPRTLFMSEYKYGVSADKQNKNPITIQNNFEDGDLFLLHHCDEMPKYRGGKKHLTKMVHGGVKFGKNAGMSGALCLRRVDNIELFNAETGVVANPNMSPDDKRYDEFVRRDEKLELYLGSSVMEAQFEKQRNLAIAMKDKYFK